MVVPKNPTELTGNAKIHRGAIFGKPGRGEFQNSKAELRERINQVGEVQSV